MSLFAARLNPDGSVSTSQPVRFSTAPQGGRTTTQTTSTGNMATVSQDQQAFDPSTFTVAPDAGMTPTPDGGSQSNTDLMPFPMEAPTPFYKKWWFWAILGVGAAGGTYYYVKHK